eukprot:1207561-Prymnesium_polylepis.1
MDPLPTPPKRNGLCDLLRTFANAMGGGRNREQGRGRGASGNGGGCGSVENKWIFASMVFASIPQINKCVVSSHKRVPLVKWAKGST